MSTTAQTIPPAVAVKTILVVDDVPFCRELVAEALRGRGFHTVRASNGREGLAALEANHIDLVICDVGMPVMDGIEFMQAVRASERWKRLPIILLTGADDKRIIQSAGRSGAAEYVLKSNFGIPDLVTRVNRNLGMTATPPKRVAPKQIKHSPRTIIPNKLADAAMTFEKLLERDQVFAAIDGALKNAKLLGGVISAAMTITDGTHSNSEELAVLIGCDPVLAARVIGAANAAEATKHRFTSIETAAKELTDAGVREIVQSAEPHQSFPAGAVDGIDLLRAIQHSIAVATMMDQLVPRGPDVGAGAAYLVGLLHNLGDILLRQALPAQYKIAHDLAATSNCSVRQVIPRVMGATLAEITAHALTGLKLPGAVVNTIRKNAEWADRCYLDSVPPGVSTMTFALRCAALFANAAQVGADPREAFIAPLPQSAFRTSGITRQKLDVQDIRSYTIDQTIRLANDPNAAALLAHSPTPQHKPKIAYVRQSTFAALDPLHDALAMFADVAVFDRPPTRAEELNGIDAMFVAATQQGGVPVPRIERCHELAASVGTDLRVLYFVERETPNAPPAPDWLRVVELPVSLASLAALVDEYTSTVQ